MSGQSMQTLIDPVFQSKMPLFDGTVASTGLSKPQAMSGFLGKETLQYSGAYFAYDPRGKDRAGFTPPWSNSKTSLLDGRSPVSHLSGMDGQNHIIYRQDSGSSDEGLSHSSSLCRTHVKQGFTVYTKSPGLASPTAATSAAVRKPKTGSENSSPPSENSVYLAIPRPVYRHSPCCGELGCVLGQRYSIEHGSPRMPNAVYEHDWMQPNAHYVERHKAQDSLLQQRALQQDHSEPRQRVAVETYSPSRTRTFPVRIDSDYRSYPCTPTRTLFGAVSEQSSCLQTPPRGYPSFYPSRAAYDHMTPEVYQECSPMSKYGQLLQHPIFYYPQANVEVENRTPCKDINSKHRDHVPVILKNTLSSPREHFIVPQSLHGEIPLPNGETLPNHPFMRSFDYGCYAVPRFHLSATQMRHPLQAQHASPGFHSSHVNASPSSQHVDHAAASQRKENAGAGPHLDQPSPARHTGRSATSPPRVQLNRFLPSLHLERPILPPAGLNIDRLVDYNHCEAQVPVPPAAWLPRSPCTDGVPTLGPSGANARRTIYSIAGPTGDEHSSSASSSGGAVGEGRLKRSVSQTSPPVRKKEDGDLEFRKRQKLEIENVRVATLNDSPPMPVIDNVFSLAPYQAYLQAAGAFVQGGSPRRTVPTTEQRDVNTKPDVGEKRTDQKEQQQVGDAPIHQRHSPDTSMEEITEPKVIKVEKVDPSDASEDTVSEMDCSNVTIKKELEESETPDDGPALVIKMCEPDELEKKPLLEDETSEECEPAEPPERTHSSSPSDSNTLREEAAALRTKSSTPPQPQVNFRNIPPQCLKLSTYKILLPDKKMCSPIPPPEKPPTHPGAESVPKVELVTPVRQHFLELHHFLCKLVSKSVSGSSEQELRAWLSQLKVTEPGSSSAKAQKVSCLLGVRAREAWLNDELKSALDKVLERLREYTVQERCPFPHVTRTGALFLPMLVVKELLFPDVPGGFIDQVLQEHRVELRPTTLSEEKIIVQLHKRACSSRLRRLMSLKHLPNIYADAVNLFHYSCVCKHLGLDTDDPANRELSSDDTISCKSPADLVASPVSPSESHPQRNRKERESTGSLVNGTKHIRHVFVDDSLSDEEDGASEAVLNSFGGKIWDDHHQPEEMEDRGSGYMVAEDCSHIPQSTTCENSWMCPLTLEDSDIETEESSCLQSVSQSSEPASSAVRSKSCSGVILKLRRMFSEGLKRKKARYQAVSNTETLPDAAGEVTCNRDRTTPKVTHKWQRTGSVCHALRPLSNSSKRKHSSLLKIKYCPFLSACHSAEHRRRWVLRSAVQRARRAMRFYYPDLVGKRIHHLYEEDDKSEVWYRGEVLRIHEAHTNPLKTVFEVRYDSEPEWKYYLELLIDYKKGWLKIED